MSFKEERFSAWHLIAIMVIAFIVLVTRRPDIIQNAQPWAEDGRVWMAGIYNEGFWNSLILPQNGYYQTISRLTYGLSLSFGLSYAALSANIIAVLIRCFFVAFILSSRINFIDLKYRLVAALYFILMPNISEGFVNITNAHWYLSMYLVAIVLAKDTETLFEKVHDYIVLIISGLSGPFVVFIAPCLLIKRIYTRGGFFAAIKKINLFDITMAACCLIQIAAILSTSEATRPNSPLGYSFELLADIVSCRIIYGSFLPFNLAREMAAHGNVNIFIFVALCVVLVFSFLKFGWRVKSLILFPVLMIGFALARPVIAMDQPQWPLIFNTESGERYFYVTNIALACLSLGFVALLPKYRTSVLFLGVVVLMAFIPETYRLPRLPDVGYKNDVKNFETTKKGESGEINILPPGWTMKLIKK